jgi:integrase
LRTDDWRSPIARGMGKLYYEPSEHQGDRKLTDDEIRQLWSATADGKPFSQLVRFLLLTGARRNEACGIRRAEIAAEDVDGVIFDDVWTLPASRSKTKKPVKRPLSAAALAIIDAMPQIDGCPWIFSTTGLGPLTNLSDTMAALRERCGFAKEWRLHDLRRSARSLLSRAGVTSEHAERVLGHTITGVEGTYNRYLYLKEIKDAVETLAALIERIVHPPEGAVIDLQARRR